jgi:sigma-B regulation protein RsbU (phosphoserine phosphatase)
MFVTVFYGILDPVTGTLNYCNAGHNPPYLIRHGEGNVAGEILALDRTGMVLGVLQDGTWEQGVVLISPGDLLVLYTDGLVEAQASDGIMFGEERLLSVVQDNLMETAQEIQEALLAAIREFMKDAPQFDDLTLVVMARE